jgi:hypothetical protein
MERSLRMLLLRQRGAKRSENTIASGLHDMPAISPRRFHHDSQCRVDDALGLFGVQILDQLH